MSVQIVPLHKWVAGPPRNRGSVLLAPAPEDACVECGRRGKLLLFLTELWVPPAVRGRGYAGALLSAVTEWADGSGTDLWLYCAEHGPVPRLNRTQLQALYAKHGFKRCSMNSPDIEMVRYARSSN